HKDRITWVDFHPDGRRLGSLSSLEGTAKIWDVTTGQELRTFHGVSGMSAAFSTDGRYFAAATGDDTVRLWDAATGQEVRTFRGPTDEIRSVVFSPNGRLLASASYSGTVLVWRVPP